MVHDVYEVGSLQYGDDSMNLDEAQNPTPASAVRKVADALNADIFLFSGPIERELAYQFLDLVESVENRKNVAVILSTYGGDAAAA